MAQSDHMSDTEKLKRMFTFFDTDGDQSIDSEELIQCVRAFGFNPTEAEIEALMKEYDLSKTGRLDCDEFIACIEAKFVGVTPGTDPREIVQAFKIFDKDRNGKIGVDYFREFLTTLGEKLSSKDVANMLRLCETADAGYVDYEAFVKFISEATANQSIVSIGLGN